MRSSRSRCACSTANSAADEFAITAEPIRIAGIRQVPVQTAVKLGRLLLVKDTDDDRTPEQRAFDEANRLVDDSGFRP